MMQNKSHLKHGQGGKIFINDDLTKEERDIQRKIRQTFNEEKAKGKNVKMGFLKVIVEGEIWKWNKGEGRLNKISYAKEGSKNKLNMK